MKPFSSSLLFFLLSPPPLLHFNLIFMSKHLIVSSVLSSNRNYFPPLLCTRMNSLNFSSASCWCSRAKGRKKTWFGARDPCDGWLSVCSVCCFSIARNGDKWKWIRDEMSHGGKSINHDRGGDLWLTNIKSFLIESFRQQQTLLELFN